MKQPPRQQIGQAQTFWKDYWLGLYATPRAWAHKGELLVNAFEAVADATDKTSMHLNMKDQALMLAGMAIEVQLKAIIVHTPDARCVVTSSKRPKKIAARSLWDAFYSHDLVDLATEAKVVLNQARTETAAALTQFIYWQGRYVLPTERGIDNLIPVQLANGLVGQPHLQVTFEAARDLISFVIEEVKARLYARP